MKKEFDIIGPVCKLQTKFPKTPIFGNATSRHANFAKLTLEMNPENFRSIFQRLAIL